MLAPAMVKKKVCILGAFAVGKTSLVRRFVNGFFADKYLSTIGVKIDRKAVRVGKLAVDLILWDIAGGLDESRSEPVYLKGLSGYLIVGDGTRPETCSVATNLVHFVEDHAGARPNILLLNKADLAEEWRVTADDEALLATRVNTVMKTSAKTGTAVEDAFSRMAHLLLPEEVYHEVDC